MGLFVYLGFRKFSQEGLDSAGDFDVVGVAVFAEEGEDFSSHGFELFGGGFAGGVGVGGELGDELADLGVLGGGEFRVGILGFLAGGEGFDFVGGEASVVDADVVEPAVHGIFAAGAGADDEGF